MLLLYLDEFGHAGAWDPADPKHRHHPLFGLGGIAIQCAKARDLDRTYFRLKTGFYKYEIEQAWRRDGKRAERFEPKQMDCRRDIRFAREVLYAVSNLGGAIVAHGVAKPVGVRNHKPVAFYNSIMQGVLRSFDGVIRAMAAESGIIIADRRSEASDTDLLGSAQSYLFSHQFELRRVAETPLLVRSDWHHGVQAADTVGRVLGGLFRYRAAGEQEFRCYEQRFGSIVDHMTVTIGRRLGIDLKSVYVRNSTRVLRALRVP